MANEFIQRVREELGARSSRGAPAVSQFLAAALADHLFSIHPAPDELKRAFSADRRATIERLLARAESWCAPRLLPLLGDLRREGLISSDQSDTLFAEPVYLERIRILALERVLVNPAAPPLLVSPLPLSHPLQQSTRPIVAALFDYPLAITHELYPLSTDAYVANLDFPHDLPHFELVGAHNSWLDSEGNLRRAILFDPELDLFLETPLAIPQPIAAALLIAQSPEAHRRLSEQLDSCSIPHVNGAAGAGLADDKWRCFEQWRASGIPTPPTLLLERAHSPASTRRTVADFIARHPDSRHGWIAQPRHGTEGRMVTWVPPEGQMIDRLLEIGGAIAAGGDDAIIRPRIGLTFLQIADRLHPFDLRLNATFDGAALAVESGYLQLAPAADEPIASVSAGGQIRPFEQLLNATLTTPSSPASGTTVWKAEFTTTLIDLAMRAVGALAPLALAGIDLKIDLEEDRLSPSILDINPRPAGLIHANLLTTGEPGIGAGLWRHLAILAASRQPN